MSEVLLTVRNPDDGTITPVAGNEYGELRLAGTPMDQFVEKDGDTMTGNLHLGDKIILNPDGSAQFAGGAFDVYTDGKLEIGSNNVTLDPVGDGTFSGNLTARNIECASGTIKLTYNGGDRVTIDANGSTFYKNTSTDSQIAKWGNNNSASNITFGANGSGTFASILKSSEYQCKTTQFNFVSLSPNKIWALKEDANKTDVLLQLGYGNTSVGQKKIQMHADGRAIFTNDVVVGSRNKQWMLVESGGICHLVEQTFREADVGTADLVDDPAAAAGEPSTYPELRNLPQELDQLRSVVTALLTEVQRVEEKLRMAPESGWPVWDGSD